MESQIDYHARFLRESLEGFEEDLQDIATDKEKQELLTSIQSFAFSAIKEPLTRPAAEIQMAQQGLDVLWQKFLKASAAIGSASLFQDRLVLLLLWTKQFDQMNKGLYTGQSATKDWESFGFVESVQTFWERLVSNSTETELHGLATFSAKVLSAGVCQDKIAATCLCFMREALEISDERATRLLPGAVIWMEHCNHVLLKYCVLGKISQQSEQSSLSLGLLAEDSVIDKTGFSIERWLFWRRRFQRLSHDPDSSIAKDAKKGFMAMINCGRDLDYEVPGEEAFTKKLQATMWAELIKSGKESLDGDEIDIDPDWVDQEE
ncbi:hypothetical protein F53441_3046 [Fusarium austroafricanum]|uniref:Uncharacterized protein n=1 Tax=Fusarium austroafricanum TaxID=2364996 RepID=A0A8H4KN88_9HYPO|nr:hypothetical protein F53441_3046 [Fusarium austroafricanum]